MKTFRSYLGLIPVVGLPVTIVLVSFYLLSELQVSGDLAWLRQQYIPHAGWFYREFFGLVDQAGSHSRFTLLVLLVAALWLCASNAHRWTR